MNDAFKKANLESVQAVSEAVYKFEKGWLTALVSDWSKVEVGIILCQKHC